MRSSRSTASARTSATSRRRTRQSCASAGRARSTGARSRPSATSRKTKRSPASTRHKGRIAERRARLHYRVRGYRVLGANVWAGGYELDLVMRRGRRVVFCEVKAKSGPRYGDPLEMIGPEKLRRLWRAAEGWLAGGGGCRGVGGRFGGGGVPRGE